MVPVVPRLSEVSGLRPAPRQKFVDAVDRMIVGDAGEDAPI